MEEVVHSIQLHHLVVVVVVHMELRMLTVVVGHQPLVVVEPELVVQVGQVLLVKVLLVALLEPFVLKAEAAEVALAVVVVLVETVTAQAAAAVEVVLQPTFVAAMKLGAAEAAARIIWATEKCIMSLLVQVVLVVAVEVEHTITTE
jgi:hypothetical protein